MEQVRRARLDDDAAEGADVAALTVVSVLALLSLRIKPGVGGDQHVLGRGFDRPGIRGAVIIFKKAGHRCLRCLLADIAATDAVSQRDGNALAAELRPFGNEDAMKILVDFLAPLVGILPDGDPELRLMTTFNLVPLCTAARKSYPAQFWPKKATGLRGHQCRSGSLRFGAVRTCVEYSVRPTKARPPTRLPSTVGSSFQIR
jgi:hypothetical protein